MSKKNPAEAGLFLLSDQIVFSGLRPLPKSDAAAENIPDNRLVVLEWV
jgi:hypothetical protein